MQRWKGHCWYTAWGFEQPFQIDMAGRWDPDSLTTVCAAVPYHSQRKW